MKWLPLLIILGLLIYARRVNMANYCFRQIKPASEMSDNEVARTLCLRNGEVTWGKEGHSGSPSDVWINPGCPEGGKVIGTYHTHPQGISEPSSRDINEMLRAKLPFMCVHGEEALSCYRIKK